MTIIDSTAAARDQLNRTLTFFPRVDGKASVLLAVNTSMMAVLATRAFPYTQLRWELLPIGLAIVGLIASLWNLYRQGFPHLDGGQNSRLYFREIAGRTEAGYIADWQKMTDEDYLQDLLGQVWRNSQILKIKFGHLRNAFVALAFALVPWVVALALLSQGQTT